MNDHRKFKQYLDSAIVRGFVVSTLFKKESYRRYKDDPRVIKILDELKEGLKN